MKRPAGPLPVTIALALGSMALGAATLSPQAPARATPPAQGVNFFTFDARCGRCASGPVGSATRPAS